MESLANFQDGLKAAFKELEEERTLRGKDKEVWEKAIRVDARVRLNERPALSLRRCQFRIRRLYASSHGLIFAPAVIDWTAIVDWIKEHWQDILRILLTIVPFIL